MANNWAHNRRAATGPEADCPLYGWKKALQTFDRGRLEAAPADKAAVRRQSIKHQNWSLIQVGLAKFPIRILTEIWFSDGVSLMFHEGISFYGHPFCCQFFIDQTIKLRSTPPDHRWPKHQPPNRHGGHGRFGYCLRHCLSINGWS